MVAKNWSSLLIEVTISKRLFVVMPENGMSEYIDYVSTNELGLNNEPLI